MFCKKCGCELEEGNTFCTNCGNSINSDDNNETSNIGIPKSEANRKLVIVCALVFIIIFLLIFAIIVLVVQDNNYGEQLQIEERDDSFDIDEEIVDKALKEKGENQENDEVAYNDISELKTDNSSEVIKESSKVNNIDEKKKESDDESSNKDIYISETDEGVVEEFENALNSPFYGIWIGASKVEADANVIVENSRNNGIDTMVFLTTDWTNLNKDPYYVITAGIYSSKEDAEKAVEDVKKVYPDAYVKYSGEYIE